MPSKVFAAYAAGDGFFTGEGKKDQFPDAFIFECKAEASENKPVIIVSNDGDFNKPIEAQVHILLVKTLPELFTALGLQVDAPELDDFLDHHKAELVEMVDHELRNWGLVGDIEDSEIDDTKVTDVEVRELTSFGSTEEGGSILVVGSLSVTADVSYTHPNWDEAIYDSEDKQLFVFDDVSGETEINFDVDVSMSIAVDDDGNPEQIEELSFRNDNFRFVQLSPHDYH